MQTVAAGTEEAKAMNANQHAVTAMNDAPCDWSEIAPEPSFSPRAPPAEGSVSPFGALARPEAIPNAIYQVFTVNPTINGFFESKAHNLRGSAGRLGS
jgi:hypothetical protein